MTQLDQLELWGLELKNRDDSRSKSQFKALLGITSKLESALWQKSLRHQLEKLSRWIDYMATYHPDNGFKIKTIHRVAIRIAKKKH